MAEKLGCKRPYIAIAGNIGAGKTTLVGLIEAGYPCRIIPEPLGTNPFLEKYYQDPKRWAFPCQIAFLSERFAQQQTLADLGPLPVSSSPLFIVQDRSLFEDCEIFATHLWKLRYLTDDEWQIYKRLYDQIVRNVVLPNRIVYLRASVENLIKRIRCRGRTYEGQINMTYLSRLNELYEVWIAKLGSSMVSVIDTDDIDLARSKQDQRLVLERLQHFFESSISHQSENVEA